MLYVEMLEAGFTRVGEFHYLHHDADGRPYDNVAELAERIAAAADETGIGLTLIPTFYAHATFGGAPPLPEQRRFICDIELFARLLEASRNAVAAIAGRESRRRAAQPARRDTGRDRALLSRWPGRSDPHPRRGTGEGGGGLPRLVGQTAGRMAAGACAGRPPLVPDPRDAHDGCGNRSAGCERRDRRSLPDHRSQSRRRHLQRPALRRGRRPLWHRLRFQHPHRRRRRAAAARICAAAASDRARNVMAVEGGSTGRALFETALAGGDAALGVGRGRDRRGRVRRYRDARWRASGACRRARRRSSTRGSLPEAKKSSIASSCAGRSASRTAATSRARELRRVSKPRCVGLRRLRSPDGAKRNPGRAGRLEIPHSAPLHAG